MDKLKIVAMANDNERLMDGTTRPVAQILKENDIVFAVWQDWRAEDGVSTLVLKGERFARDIVKSGVSREARWSAVKVVSHEMAIAARETLGEAEGQDE